MTTAIIIPCYLLPDKDHKLRRFTEQCIQSIRAYTSDYRLFLVDNGSPVDGEWLHQQANYYLRNPRNLGFAPAVNQGLRCAIGEGCDWLVVMNNDITVLPGWLETMQGAWGEETGAVSSHLHDHDPQHLVGRELVHPGLMFGALWLTRPNVVRHVGYLDEEYTMGYWEDRDYWMRIHVAGLELVKAGWCHHIGNATSGKLPNLNEFFERNKQRFQERWGKV